MSEAGTNRQTAIRLWRAAAVVLATVTIAALASCTPTTGLDSTPSPTADSSSKHDATSEPAPQPTRAPELVEGGTAEQNKAFFDEVVRAIVTDGNPGGRAIVDRTPIGSAVDSLQFSVEFDDGCLIGQTGGGRFTSIVASALESGGCLLGDTRTIDW